MIMSKLPTRRFALFFECADVRQSATIGTFEKTTSTVNAKTWQLRG